MVWAAHSADLPMAKIFKICKKMNIVVHWFYVVSVKGSHPYVAHRAEAHLEII